MNYKGVIFSLDGSLLDSKNVWTEVAKNFFKLKNLPIPINYNKSIEELTILGIAKFIIDLYKFEETPEELVQIWTNMLYFQYKNNIKLKEGAYEYLVYLMENGIKFAIVTTYEKKLYELCLKSNKIYDFFEVIVDSTLLKKENENSNIYLICAEKLGVNPKDCIIFADILNDIWEIKKLGMKICIVYDKYTQENKEELLNYCDEYITDFRELII